jgi:predicted PurR-regulated permease PerM
MKNSLFSFSYLFITISIITYSFLLKIIKAQEIILSEEKQLLNNCSNYFNKTQAEYQELREKMQFVKYNIFLRARYRDVNKIRDIIEKQISKIQETINTNKYDKNAVINEIKELNVNIERFEKKCNKAINIYNYNKKLGEIIVDFLKVFFTTMFIIIIIGLIVIGIVSFFVIKRQRKYYKLKEEISIEVTNPDEIEVPNKIDNLKNNKIEEKVIESSERIISNKKKKPIEKVNYKNNMPKNNNIDVIQK